MTWFISTGKCTGRSLPLALLLSITLAGCGGDQSATAVIDNSPAPRQVRIATAVEAKVARTVSATGTLAAEDQVVLGTKVIGRLGEISVDLGTRVRKGQAIARIDPSDYRLRVDQAEAAEPAPVGPASPLDEQLARDADDRRRQPDPDLHDCPSA